MLLLGFMLRATSLHAYMFRSTCFIPYAMLSCVLFLFLLQVDVKVTGSHACMMFLAAWVYGFMCLFPCYMVRSKSSHACMLGFMFFHIYVLGLYMLLCMFLCPYVQIYDFHMPMCLDLYFLHALYYLSCACAPHAIFVCIDLGCVCHAMCCSFYHIFLCFGLLVWT